MAQAWPSPAEIAAAVDRIGDAEEAPEAKPADETTEAQPETKTEEVKVEETREEAPAPDIAAIAQEAKDKGPRSPDVKALLAQLDEPTLSALGEAVLPKLQAKLSTRSNQLNEAQRIIEELRRTDSAAERRHDEMMTVGMSEEDKRKYLDDKTRQRGAEAAQATQARAADNARILGTLWNIVNAAGLPVEMDASGLPREDADPDVKRLWETAWHESDPNVVFRHFVTEAPKIAERRKAAKAQPEAKPTVKTYTKDEVQEILQKGVQEALIKAGVLSADTGKSSGGGTRAPKDKNEMIAEVSRRLSASAR